MDLTSHPHSSSICPDSCCTERAKWQQTPCQILVRAWVTVRASGAHVLCALLSERARQAFLNFCVEVTSRGVYGIPVGAGIQAIDRPVCSPDRSIDSRYHVPPAKTDEPGGTLLTKVGVGIQDAISVGAAQEAKLASCVIGTPLSNNFASIRTVPACRKATEIVAANRASGTLFTSELSAWLSRLIRGWVARAELPARRRLSFRRCVCRASQTLSKRCGALVRRVRPHRTRRARKGSRRVLVVSSGTERTLEADLRGAVLTETTGSAPLRLHCLIQEAVSGWAGLQAVQRAINLPD
eukprot:1537367-Rhodomonas_salina.1